MEGDMMGILLCPPALEHQDDVEQGNSTGVSSRGMAYPPACLSASVEKEKIALKIVNLILML